MPTTVTLKHVAIEAGIHASAVSRVLRGQDAALRLSERRRQEIKAAAERLGYRPNAAAAATVSGKFNSISLVCGTGSRTSTLMQGLVNGLTDTLAAHDMQMVFARLSDAALSDERELPLFLRQHSCDGLLLNYTHHVPTGVRQIIEKYRIPSIWLNVKQDHDCVHPDDFNAGLTATRWLLERGHTRVCYLEHTAVTLEGEAHYSIADRRGGYLAAMKSAGLSPNIITIEGGLAAPADQRSIVDLRALLGSPDRPTAAVGYGGEIDLACSAAMSMGLNVPNDLDLVRFKETVARLGHVVLPTLRIPQKSFGQAAVDAIVKKVDQPARKLNPVAVPFQDIAPTINDHTGEQAPPLPTDTLFS